MNYLSKQMGGSLTSFVPKWEQLKSKQINLFPKDWDTLMPMKNPAFRSDVMYNGKRSYLDEYNKLMLQQNSLAEQLKNKNLPILQQNKLRGNLSEYPGFIKRLYEEQVAKTNR